MKRILIMTTAAFLLLSCDKGHTIIDPLIYGTFIVDNECDRAVVLNSFIDGEMKTITLNAGGQYKYWQEILQIGTVEPGKVPIFFSDSLEITIAGQSPFKLYKRLLPQAVAPKILNDYWVSSRDEKNNTFETMTINQEMLDKVYGNK